MTLFKEKEKIKFRQKVKKEMDIYRFQAPKSLLEPEGQRCFRR